MHIELHNPRMVAEGNDDEIEDVVIPTIPDAVGPMVSQGLSNLGLIIICS